MFLAQNPNTPSNILEQLANNSYLTVLLNLVRNPNTPARTFAQILENARELIKVPNQSKDNLQNTFDRDACDLLKAIAASSRTPTNVLEILALREFTLPPPNPKFLKFKSRFFRT